TPFAPRSRLVVVAVAEPHEHDGSRAGDTSAEAGLRMTDARASSRNGRQSAGCETGCVASGSSTEPYLAQTWVEGAARSPSQPADEAWRCRLETAANLARRCLRVVSAPPCELQGCSNVRYSTRRNV